MVIKSAFIANHLLVLGPEKWRDDERNMIKTMDGYVYEGLQSAINSSSNMLSSGLLYLSEGNN